MWSHLWYVFVAICLSSSHPIINYPPQNRDAHKQTLSDANSSDHVKALKLRLRTAETALRQAQRRDSVGIWSRGITRLVAPFAPPHPDDSESIDIADSLRALSALSLDAPPDPGFQGKSSAAMLIKVAVSTRLSVLGDSPVRTPDRMTPKPWTLKPVC